MNPAIELSNATAALVEKTAGSIVRVEARGQIRSGTVWGSSDMVVVAAHTLDCAEVVVWNGDERSPARVVGGDPVNDIALLRTATPLNATPVTGATKDPRVGELAVSLAQSATGTRAALSMIGGRAERIRSCGTRDTYWTTDTRVTPAFSGGPLMDLSGAAIGINTAGLVRGAVLCVPANAITDAIARSACLEASKRAYLGVGAYTVRLPRVVSALLGQSTGVLLVSIDANSPAASAGLHCGDIVVSVDGRPLLGSAELSSRLNGGACSAFKMTVVRNGATSEVAVSPKEESA